MMNAQDAHDYECDRAIWRDVLKQLATKCGVDQFRVDRLLRRAYPEFTGKNITYFLDMPAKHFWKERPKTVRRAVLATAEESGDSRGGLFSPPEIK